MPLLCGFATICGCCCGPKSHEMSLRLNYTFTCISYEFGSSKIRMAFKHLDAIVNRNSGHVPALEESVWEWRYVNG